MKYFVYWKPEYRGRERNIWRNGYPSKQKTLDVFCLLATPWLAHALVSMVFIQQDYVTYLRLDSQAGVSVGVRCRENQDQSNQVIGPMYAQCWTNCSDVGLTLNRHCSRLVFAYGLFLNLGGGPRVVVSTAAFHARVRGSVPGLGGLKETKFVSSPSTCES